MQQKQYSYTDSTTRVPPALAVEVDPNAQRAGTDNRGGHAWHLPQGPHTAEDEAVIGDVRAGLAIFHFNIRNPVKVQQKDIPLAAILLQGLHIAYLTKL